MDDGTYKYLLVELNDIKTKIAIADFFITNFKEQDHTTLEKIEALKIRLDELDKELDLQVQNLDKNIVQRIIAVEQNITNVASKMDTFSNNKFLEFTNDIDSKKWVTIISVIISFMLGNGVIDNTITDRITPDDTSSAKIEKLINDMLIEQQKK